jgi:hypothetical protein
MIPFSRHNYLEDCIQKYKMDVDKNEPEFT